MKSKRLLLMLLLLTMSIMILAPLKAFPANPITGKQVYIQLCLVCHGESGKGDGPGAAMVDPKPKSFAERWLITSKTDDSLLRVIRDGGVASGLSAAMPPFGGALSDSQIKDLIAYIRTLAR
ncbi:MAG: cytochrome c [Candidatus Tectomicrobia bacterium]|nr:cytochrome c [Candidatus Tectomicrobia bacterium]